MSRPAKGWVAIGWAGTGRVRMGQVGTGQAKTGRLGTCRSGTGRSRKKLHWTVLFSTELKIQILKLFVKMTCTSIHIRPISDLACTGRRGADSVPTPSGISNGITKRDQKSQGLQ
jgi:hypothetical protein